MNWLKNLFKPPEKKEVFTDDLKVIKKSYMIKRNQVLIFATISYIMYYFTRKSVDLTGNALMQKELLSKENFALMGMFFSIVYGLSKFIVGGFADRSSGRIVMSFGLLVSAILNISLGGVVQFFGKINFSALTMMITLLILLGLFQGMGWPATARMFAHWFTDKERSKKKSFWNCGHGIGGGLLPLIVLPLIEFLDPEGKILGLYYWIPSIFAFMIIPFVFWGLRDRPESEGLPTIEKFKGLKENELEKKELNLKTILIKYVLKNKYVWILAFANIWVYVLRQGISSWSLKMAKDIHEIDLKESKMLWPFFEWSGIAGGIFCAYFSSWFFKNRKAPLMIFGLFLAIIGLIIFQTATKGNIELLYTAVIISGFGIYMPQSMIGATSVELTNKKAAASASGLTGLLGYFGDAVMSKPVVAVIQDDKNWDNVFYYFYACALLAIVSISLLWNKNEKNKLI